MHKNFRMRINYCVKLMLLYKTLFFCSVCTTQYPLTR